MQFNTRFNPTANGHLHLGHVYIALFNEHMAHSTHSNFIVRIDDNSIDTMYTIRPDDINRFADAQIEAIEWLGIKVDKYVRQTQMQQEFSEFIAHHGWYIPEYKWKYSIPINPVFVDQFKDVGARFYPYKLIEVGEWYPYSDYLTFTKVVYDELIETNVVIRGDDLRSEFALYQHWRKWLNLSEIDHYYMPRMYAHDDAIISKFQGAKSILEYKQLGWLPADILDLLAKSALKQPDEGWNVYNVKREPRLDEAFSISK